MAKKKLESGKYRYSRGASQGGADQRGITINRYGAIFQENNFSETEVRLLIRVGKVLFKMSGTYQTLLGMSSDMQFVSAYRLIFTGIFYLLMMVEGCPWRKCNEEHPQQKE
jgi:hypothetical protein